MDTYKIYVRLKNAQERFIRETGKTAYDFAVYYVRCWKLHASTVIRDSLEKVQTFYDWSDFYENGNDVVNGFAVSPTLDGLSLECDPNNRRDIVSHTEKLLDTYSKLDKQKKVTNYCMSCMGHLT